MHPFVKSLEKGLSTKELRRVEKVTAGGEWVHDAVTRHVKAAMGSASCTSELLLCAVAFAVAEAFSYS